MFADLAAELLDGRRLSTRAFPEPLDAGTLVAGIRARLPELREVVATGVSYGDLARAIGDLHVASRMGADVDGRAVAASVGAILVMEHDTTAEAPQTQAAAQAAGPAHLAAMVAKTDALPPGAMRDAMQAYVQSEPLEDAETKLAIALRFCGSDIVAAYDGCIAFLVQMRGLLAELPEPAMDDTEVDAWLHESVQLPAWGALPPSPPQGGSQFWDRLHRAAEHPFETHSPAEPEPAVGFDPWAEEVDMMDELARILNLC